MKCNLCGKNFSIHAQTYKPMIIPDPKLSGVWKKGLRSETIMVSYNVCVECLTALQNTIKMLFVSSPPPEDLIPRTSKNKTVRKKEIEPDLLDKASEEAMEDNA